MNVQHLFLSGRATGDANLLESKSGNKYTKFSIAINEKIKKDDKNKEDVEKVSYYDILIFGQGAQIATDMVKKGDQLIVHGKPQVSAYISKKDEQPKAVISVLADTWRVLK